MAQVNPAPTSAPGNVSLPGRVRAGDPAPKPWCWGSEPQPQHLQQGRKPDILKPMQKAEKCLSRTQVPLVEALATHHTQARLSDAHYGPEPRTLLSLLSVSRKSSLTRFAQTEACFIHFLNKWNLSFSFGKYCSTASLKCISENIACGKINIARISRVSHEVSKIQFLISLKTASSEDMLTNIYCAALCWSNQKNNFTSQWKNGSTSPAHFAPSRLSPRDLFLGR